MPPREHTGPSLHISATRLGSFAQGCKRAWALEYIAGITRPAGKGHLKGSALHWVAEHWLRDGTPPSLCPPLPADHRDFRFLSEAERTALLNEVRPRFAAGVPYLPEPRSEGLYVEEPFTLTLDIGQSFSGTMDAVVAGTKTGRVYDHKSTKTLEYCKSPDELRRDPQVLCYGYRLASHGNYDQVHFRWVYYRMTGAPYAQPVDLTLDRSYLEAAWKRINVVAGEMYNLWQARIEPITIQGNRDHCKKFGGCFYYSICQERDPSMSSVAAPASAGSSLFNTLVTAGVTPGVQPAPASGPVDLFGGADSAPVPTVPVVQPPPASAPAPSDIAAAILARLSAATTGQPAAVVAPAAAQSVAPVVQAPAVALCPTATTAGPVAASQAAPGGSLMSGPMPAPAGVAAPPVAEPKRRGRPKGSKNAPAVAPVVGMVDPIVAAGSGHTVPGTEGPAYSIEGLTLYVGCRPTKGAGLDAVINTLAELRGVTLDGAIYVPANVDAGVLAMLEAVADRVVRVAV